MEWATNTCTLTFTTVGIWPDTADGTDVNYCDRSHDGELTAVGDDAGKIKIYTWPVIQTKVSVKFFHIRVRFICHFNQWDKLLDTIYTGGN